MRLATQSRAAPAPREERAPVPGRLIANVRVGKPDVSMDAPAHTRGVREGNEPGSFERTPGYYREGNWGKGTARRSTGINPERRNPIDPRSPNLSPP